MVRLPATLLLLLIAWSPAVPAASPPAGVLDARFAGFPTVTIQLDDAGIHVLDVITAGRTLFIADNTTAAPSHLRTVRVPDDITDDQLTTDLADLPHLTPAWFDRATFLGTPDRTASHAQTFGLVDVIPGRYIVLDQLAGSTTFARLTVLAADGAEIHRPPAPVADVTVMMDEMAFAISGVVPTGEQVWQIADLGRLPHDLAMYPVPAGATDAQVIEAITTVLQGQDLWTSHLDPLWFDWSFVPISGTGVVSPGGTVWAQFDLPLGTYAVLCLFAGTSTVPQHLMDGMVQIFTVT
jgi:hypothetical protein